MSDDMDAAEHVARLDPGLSHGPPHTGSSSALHHHRCGCGSPCPGALGTELR